MKKEIEQDPIGAKPLKANKEALAQLLLNGYVDKKKAVKYFFQAGFKAESPKVALKKFNAITSSEEFKKRVKFLKDEAWQLIKPTTYDMALRYDALRKKSNTPANVKLQCLHAITELAGLKDKETGQKNQQAIVINFNGKETTQTVEVKKKGR